MGMVNTNHKSPQQSRSMKHSQRKTPLWFRATLYLLLATWSDITVGGHADLGLHGLSGENPIGDPILPPIQGAFQVELNARFVNVTTDGLHTLFEYSTVDHSNTIFFGVFTAGAANGVLRLEVNVDGTSFVCQEPIAAMVRDTLYKYKFGVSATNVATIYQNGVLEKACSGAPVPLNVPRNHSLGTGTLTTRMQGAVDGLRVSNEGQQQHPRNTFALWNLPGQPFASSFVASFYARFDNISGGRRFQIVFDLANGQQDNNILCGQLRSGANFYCQVVRGDVQTVIVVPNAIVEGEFAFWHFGVNLDGAASTIWIDKNGIRLKEQVEPDLELENVFRRQLLFGTSTFGLAEHAIDGVVLGFRLDSALSS